MIITDIVPKIVNPEGNLTPAANQKLTAEEFNVIVDTVKTINSIYANSYFDDNVIVGNIPINSTASAKISLDGNTVYGLIDNYTDEQVSYSKVTGKTDADIDGIIIRKKGNNYFKRNGVVTIKNFGAKGDGVTNDTIAIQKAINVSCRLKYTLKISTGVYIILPNISVSDESGNNILIAFTIQDNLHIVADSGAIFKISNNISSDASPQPMRMFFSNSITYNWSITGLTMDMNGQNNLISPLRNKSPYDGNNYNRFTQAAICISGTPGGVAARAENVVIDHCQFLNGAGVSVILMAQTNSRGLPLSKNWKVTNNRFYNNGFDTDDHSSIFGWADDVLIEDNNFDNPNMFSGITHTGGLVTHEIHGANHIYRNNIVNNYYQAVWVASNFTSNSDNSIIENNKVRVGHMGFAFFREYTYNSAASEFPINNTTISNNNIIISSDNINSEPCAGIRITPTYAINGINIKNNIIEKEPGVSATFGVIIGTNLIGQTHSNINITDNIVNKVVVGIFITTTNAPLETISISNNTFINQIAQAGYTSTYGIYVSGNNSTNSIRNLIINSNKFLTPSLNTGIGLSNTTHIINLIVDSNIFDISTIGLKYNENSAIVDNKIGTEIYPLGTSSRINAEIDKVPYSVVQRNVEGSIYGYDFNAYNNYRFTASDSSFLRWNGAEYVFGDSGRIVSNLAPTNSNHLTTKAYVDARKAEASADVTTQAISPNATDLASAITLVNELKAKLNSEIAELQDLKVKMRTGNILVSV